MTKLDGTLSTTEVFRVRALENYLFVFLSAIAVL